MKAIKFNYGLLFLCLVFIGLVGCSTMKYKNPDAPDYSVAVLTSDKPNRLRIATVDGKKATGKFKGETVREFPDTLRLLPGYHEIVPCLLSVKGVRYGETLTFYAQEEMEYVVCYKVKWDKTIRFWVECNGVDITTEN